MDAERRFQSITAWGGGGLRGRRKNDRKLGSRHVSSFQYSRSVSLVYWVRLVAEVMPFRE